MNDNNALSIFPKTRIKPYDGMAITADVWVQAHEEHRKARRAHDVVFHQPGIVTGLMVQASDPPDQYVFISPGVAVDSVGNIIVLTETVAYDFGSKAEGFLYLLLVNGESEVGGVDKEVKQVQSEFVIAARSSLPKRPAVELARIQLESDQPIKNAANPAHPGLGELDLRFRVETDIKGQHQVYVGLCSIGREVEDVAAGWRFLADECSRSSPYKLIVDTGIPLGSDLTCYDLVYVSANEAFSMDVAAIKSFQAYLDQKKVLFAEALDSVAEESFLSFFLKLKRKLSPLVSPISLLETPFLFAIPPTGAQGNNLQIGKQIVFSSSGYSLAWAGKLPIESHDRSDIRNAHEWGVNLIQYCLSSSLS